MSPSLSDYLPIYSGCRYCLMCRHVCPVGRTTKREANTPHGWALLIASVDRGQMTWDADAVETLYECADCGLCQSFCVTDRPLPAAIVAARARVAEAGSAPAAVAEVDAKLREWGNPYQKNGARAKAGPAENVLFVGAAAQHLRPQTLAAARELLEKLGIACALVSVGRSSAYLPYTLGLWDTARALAQSTLDEIAAAGSQRVIVLAPEDAHTLCEVYLTLGVDWPEDVAVVELVELLAEAVEAGTLKPHPLDAALTYHDPAHTPRLPERAKTARKLVAALTTQPLREMFWREQRAAPGGAVGGLEFTQPALAARMTRERLAEAAATGAEMLVTEDPLALAHLTAQAQSTPIKIEGLYELLIQRG
jgi:Fe-S oxidoreductase